MGDIVVDLMQEGYVPSWCTACYRKGAPLCVRVLGGCADGRRLRCNLSAPCPPQPHPTRNALAGRTGEHFMKIAKAGNIHNFCHPNSLFTLQEYLVRRRGGRGVGQQEREAAGWECQRLHGRPVAAPESSTPLLSSRPQNDYGSEEAKRVGAELIEKERVVGLSESAQVGGVVAARGRARCRWRRCQCWLFSCLRGVGPHVVRASPVLPSGTGPDQAQAGQGEPGRARHLHLRECSCQPRMWVHGDAPAQ